MEGGIWREVDGERWNEGDGGRERWREREGGRWREKDGGREMDRQTATEELAADEEHLFLSNCTQNQGNACVTVHLSLFLLRKMFWVRDESQSPESKIVRDSMIHRDKPSLQQDSWIAVRLHHAMAE